MENIKIKLPKPEDFTDIEGYQFKLAAAYARLYGEAGEMVIYLNSIAEAIGGDEYEQEWAKKKANEMVAKYTEK